VQFLIHISSHPTPFSPLVSPCKLFVFSYSFVDFVMIPQILISQLRDNCFLLPLLLPNTMPILSKLSKFTKGVDASLVLSLFFLNTVPLLSSPLKISLVILQLVSDNSRIKPTKQIGKHFPHLSPPNLCLSSNTLALSSSSLWKRGQNQNIYPKYLILFFVDTVTDILGEDILRHILHFISPHIRSFAALTCSHWLHTIRLVHIFFILI
jgi:hypothetical protein